MISVNDLYECLCVRLSSENYLLLSYRNSTYIPTAKHLFFCLFCLCFVSNEFGVEISRSFVYSRRLHCAADASERQERHSRQAQRDASVLRWVTARVFRTRVVSFELEHFFRFTTTCELKIKRILIT